TIAFHHTLREGNECADWLAKKGATSDVSLKIWHSYPPQLSNVLIADASGVARREPSLLSIFASFIF
ncbi:ribonuclease H, partial [Trifolium pratense]